MSKHTQSHQSDRIPPGPHGLRLLGTLRDPLRSAPAMMREYEDKASF